jgi:hypothetical protein
LHPGTANSRVDANRPNIMPATAIAAIVVMLTGVLQDADGLTPLMRAAARGDLAAVQSLLGTGADPNQATPAQRVTALMCAAYFGRTAVIDALLARGATLALKDAQGAAAVDWAALGDHPDLEKTLTGPGAALNPFLNTGLMPMWLMDKAAGQ